MKVKDLAYCFAHGACAWHTKALGTDAQSSPPPLTPEVPAVVRPHRRRKSVAQPSWAWRQWQGRHLTTPAGRGSMKGHWGGLDPWPQQHTQKPHHQGYEGVWLQEVWMTWLVGWAPGKKTPLGFRNPLFPGARRPGVPPIHPGELEEGNPWGHTGDLSPSPWQPSHLAAPANPGHHSYPWHQSVLMCFQTHRPCFLWTAFSPQWEFPKPKSPVP